MSETPSQIPSFDWSQVNPMVAWRDWLVKSESQWSEATSALMKNPQAGGPLNRQVEEARHAQRMFSEFAQASLAMANMPSRSDIEGLDERLGRLEDGLAGISAELVRLRMALAAHGAAPVASPRPPRTRQAPASAAATAAATAGAGVSAPAPKATPKPATRKGRATR
jgi:hypothetical protein